MGSPLMSIANDEIIQKVEWRTRVLKAVLEQAFDKETLSDMLDAGWQQAHSEGVLDAAHICQNVAAGAADTRGRYVAQTLADSCKKYDAMNRTDRRSPALTNKERGKL